MITSLTVLCSQHMVWRLCNHYLKEHEASMPKHTVQLGKQEKGEVDSSLLLCCWIVSISEDVSSWNLSLNIVLLRQVALGTCIPVRHHCFINWLAFYKDSSSIFGGAGMCAVCILHMKSSRLFKEMAEIWPMSKFCLHVIYLPLCSAQRPVSNLWHQFMLFFWTVSICKGWICPNSKGTFP